MILLVFLLGLVAGVYGGLLLSLWLRPSSDHLTIIVVPMDHASRCICERFMAARMLKHGIIERSRN